MIVVWSEVSEVTDGDSPWSPCVTGQIILACDKQIYMRILPPPEQCAKH